MKIPFYINWPNSYENFTSYFAYENIFHVWKCFISVHEMKISYVKWIFICESSISYVKYMFRKPTFHLWKFEPFHFTYELVHMGKISHFIYEIKISHVLIF